MTAGGRLRICSLEDPAFPPSPNPAGCPAAGTASAPRSLSLPGGDSDLTPRVPRIERPEKRQHFRVASTEVDSGRQRPQSARGQERARRLGRWVVALSGGPSGRQDLPPHPHSPTPPRVNLEWAPAISSLGAGLLSSGIRGLKRGPCFLLLCQDGVETRVTGSRGEGLLMLSTFRKARA